jgi:hypothetical protein
LVQERLEIGLQRGDSLRINSIDISCAQRPVGQEAGIDQHSKVTGKSRAE